MKIKNLASLADLTREDPEARIAAEHQKLLAMRQTPLHIPGLEQLSADLQAWTRQSQEAVAQSTAHLERLATSFGNVLVDIRGANRTPRRWVATVERNDRDLMERVVIQAED